MGQIFGKNLESDDLQELEGFLGHLDFVARLGANEAHIGDTRSTCSHINQGIALDGLANV